MTYKTLPAVTRGTHTNILTALPNDIHKKLSLMSIELNINRADLYAMLLIYCVEYSKVSIDEIVSIVSGNRV